MSAVETNTLSAVGKKMLKWLIPFIILCIAAFIFQYLKNSKPKAQPKPAKQRIWTVQTYPITLGQYQPELVLYGKAEAPQTSKLTAAVTAYVETVNIKEGQTVTAGDTLIQLDPRDATLNLRQQEASLQGVQAQLNALEVQHQADQAALRIEKSLYALAKKSVQRFSNLAKRQVSSQDKLDNAKKAYQQQALSLNNREQAIRSYPAKKAQLNAQLAQAQALYEKAQLDLTRTTVVAPFSGKVSHVAISVGDRVRSGEVLTTLYDPQQVQIRAQIPTKNLGPIRHALVQNQPLHAQTSVDGQSLSLTLVRLASTVATGKAGVDALFELHTDHFSPETGRTVSLTLKLPAQPNVIALPPLALYGVDRVYRVTEGALEALTVKRVGSFQDDSGQTRLLIQSPQLHVGDHVVTTQLPNAISGLPVKIAE